MTPVAILRVTVLCAIAMLAIGITALVTGVTTRAADAVAAHFDPPPAQIVPLAPTAVALEQSDADLLAARIDVVGQDGKAAVASYRQAIEAGNVVAMVELADLETHANAANVPIDKRHAGQLYQRAALMGYALGQRRFGEIYEHGDGIARDEARALAWYDFAAAQGDDICNVRLAMAYLTGDGVAKDEAKALHYVEQGAQAGGIRSRLYLAYFLRHGIATPEDDARAFHLTFMAAEQDDRQAQVALSRLYAAGIGIAADPDQALHWYDRSRQSLAQPAPDDDHVVIPE